MATANVLDPTVRVTITEDCPFFLKVLRAGQYSVPFVMDAMAHHHNSKQIEVFDPAHKETKEERKLTQRVQAFVAVRETTTIDIWPEPQPSLARRLWNWLRGKDD